MSAPEDESQLIERYFAPLGARRADVILGIGDDAALLQVPDGSELVMTTDALVEGTHFLPGAPARSLGHRALAVNLSDVAAMGARPSWMLLSLVLPQADLPWLEQFSAGLAALALEHNVALVGGNLSRGPLSITVQLAGVVPAGQALRRTGGHPGDELYVSGTLGDAAGGRELTVDEPADGGSGTDTAPGVRSSTGADSDSGSELARQSLRRRFEYPQPRVALGEALRGLAHACIDVSDGLYVDAARLAQASGCGVRIDAARLPLSEALRQQTGIQAVTHALYGGEDYELCFCAAPGSAAAIEQAAARLQLPVSRIGTLLAATGVDVTSLPREVSRPSAARGFDHFRGAG